MLAGGKRDVDWEQMGQLLLGSDWEQRELGGLGSSSSTEVGRGWAQSHEHKAELSVALLLYVDVSSRTQVTRHSIGNGSVRGLGTNCAHR